MSVKIYTTPSCGYCNMAKAYFKKNNIQFVEFNVAKDMAKAQEMVKKSGQMGVPVLDVNGKIIVGSISRRSNRLSSDDHASVQAAYQCCIRMPKATDTFSEPLVPARGIETRPRLRSAIASISGLTPSSSEPTITVPRAGNVNLSIGVPRVQERRRGHGDPDRTSEIG